MRETFVHLHVHTEYSVLDGACRLEDLLQKASAWEMPALAITDHGNLCGAVDFMSKTSKAGIKPILGVEVYMAPTSRTIRDGTARDLSHMVLLAKNKTGYDNLVQISSKSFVEGFYYKPRVDLDLLSQHSDGLIAMTACLKGWVPKAILEGNTKEAGQRLGRLLDIYGRENVFIELQVNGLSRQMELNAGLVDLAGRFSVPVVATNDCHYLEKDDAEAHDVLLCIQTGKKISDEDRLRFESESLHFKSPAEMRSDFESWPSALNTPMMIAEMCDFQMAMGKMLYPIFELPDGVSPETYLSKLVEEGARKRFGDISIPIRDRLIYELNVINGEGYAPYFLIVSDFVTHAKDLGIPVGPGRGSVAGSLAAYCLRIHEIDPLKYNLSFERFLNPERVSMPDIDIDFCDERRNEMIQYVTDKYGAENVSQIITFVRMQSRGVVRDVARVMGLSFEEGDSLAKLLPSDRSMKVSKALDELPELKDACSKDPQKAHLFRLASRLEGLVRQTSIHPAGVVIAPSPITEYSPVLRAPNGDTTTQYEMKALESLGLLKMDFLGLRTLTVLQHTMDMIKQTRSVRMSLHEIPMDDARTFRLLQEGRGIGLFQLESSGMRNLMARLRPRNMNDLIDLVALYRPGPLDKVDDYIKVKEGRVDPDYAHPALKEILSSTHGIMLYQEQVMLVGRQLAGYSLKQADELRSAMAKKKHSLMDEHREIFKKGCLSENEISPETADKIFDMMAKFSEYGFNRSHAAGYAVVAYWTAYMKANFTAEFMASLLTSEIGSIDKIAEYVEECKACGVCLLPPDIHESFYAFTVVGGKVRYGLGALKNVGKGAANAISNERQQGPFLDLFDLCGRVDTRVVNKRVLESLISAGAMDSLPGNRAQKMAVVGDVISFGQMNRRNDPDREYQMDLFSAEAGAESVSQKRPDLPCVEEWQDSDRLDREKDILGFYLSGHPLLRYKSLFDRYDCFPLNQTKALKKNQEVILGGRVMGIREYVDRSGKTMGFVKIEDGLGEVEVTFFADSYNRNIHREGEVLFIKARWTDRKGKKQFIGMDSKQARESDQRDLHLSFHAQDDDPEILEEVSKLLLSNPGPVSLMIHVVLDHEKETLLSAGSHFHVEPTDQLLENLQDLLGNHRVQLR